MKDEDVLRISEYQSDEPDGVNVKCARCGKLIYRHATRCEYCGVNFQGEAYEFTHESEVTTRHVSRVLKWVFLVGVAMMIALMLLLAMLGI